MVYYDYFPRVVVEGYFDVYTFRPFGLTINTVIAFSLTLNFLNLVIIYTTLRHKRLAILSTVTFDQVEYNKYNKSYRV